MDILIVSNYLLYQDPSASFVHQQAVALSKYNNRVVVLVMTALGKKDPFGRKQLKHAYHAKLDGIEIVPIRYLSLSKFGKNTFNRKSVVAAVHNITSILPSDFKPQIIHAHALTTSSDVGAYLSKVFSCPLVVTTHGSDTAVPMATGGIDLLRSRADKADIIVGVSKQLSSLLASCGTKTEIKTIHNGFVPHKLEAPVEKDPYSIIQVGHLIESKRNEVTIRAFARLKKDYPQLKLTIIGVGRLRDKLEELCRELGVTESVTFTGQLPNREVFEKMSRASYFVMASKPEGFGIVYLEAMAAGCVTIGTVGQGIADIINSGENGFLVEADDVDAVVSVLDNCIKSPTLRDRISQCGKRTALDLDWAVNARKNIELYKSIL